MCLSSNFTMWIGFLLHEEKDSPSWILTRKQSGKNINYLKKRIGNSLITLTRKKLDRTTIQTLIDILFCHVQYFMDIR